MALSNACRIAFHGILLHASEDPEYQSSILPQLKVFKLKAKEGVVERVSEVSVCAGVSVPGLCYKHGHSILF